jgi:Septum formation initiator
MRAAVAFGVCLLLFGLFGDDHGVRAMLQARRNALLRQRADALRRDPAAIEAVARETLGFVKPGEILVTPSQ